MEANFCEESFRSRIQKPKYLQKISCQKTLDNVSKQRNPPIYTDQLTS